LLGVLLPLVLVFRRAHPSSLSSRPIVVPLVFPLCVAWCRWTAQLPPSLGSGRWLRPGRPGSLGSLLRFARLGVSASGLGSPRWRPFGPGHADGGLATPGRVRDDRHWFALVASLRRLSQADPVTSGPHLQRGDEPSAWSKVAALPMPIPPKARVAPSMRPSRFGCGGSSNSAHAGRSSLRCSRRLPLRGCCLGRCSSLRSCAPPLRQLRSVRKVAALPIGCT